jgi:hypothetical protein
MGKPAGALQPFDRFPFGDVAGRRWYPRRTSAARKRAGTVQRDYFQSILVIRPSPVT